MELVRKSIEYLIERSKYTRTVYVHNLSNFDSIFFLKYLAQIPDSNLKILMRDGRFIQIQLTSKDDKKNFSLTFRDSYQMLPNSLKALAKTFSVENKGIFPVFAPYKKYNNPNEEIPEFKYFAGVTLEEYNIFKSTFKGSWNFRRESIKYCEQDCRTLYQILIKFNKMIYDKFSVNI